MTKINEGWSREECRIRYVHGEKIGTRTLAKIAGVSYYTIARWCREDKWTEQREYYQRELRAKIEAKTIDKTSDRLSNELAQLNEEHIRGSELFRKIAQQFTGIIAADLQKTLEDQRLDKVTNKELTLALQRYSTIFATAVHLQRQATGMEYLNLDKAVSEVIKAGYDVSEPQPDE